MSTLREHLETARRRLSGQPAAELEAEILLAHSLDSPRSFLYANPELELPRARCDTFNTLLERRVRGEPIAYIIGHREFWSLPLKVTADVLIPRAETELLVEKALQVIPRDQACRVADLGTGSGAVALAIASERPLSDVHGVDTSAAALQIARHNAHALELEQVRFHQGSWCEPLEGEFSLMVSNPPYVAEDDPHLINGDCRFEPRHALTPGTDALAAFRIIARQSLKKLTTGGWLLFEHGGEQGKAVREILLLAGFVAVDTVRDLLGHERVTRGQRIA